MRVGIIADVHGNFPALQAVWARIKKYSFIINAGDLTGYYVDGNKVIDFIKQKKVPTVLGNHDRYILERKLPGNLGKALEKPFRYTLKNITRDNLYYIKNLPKELTFEIDRLKIGLFHGSPDNPDRRIYPDSSLKLLKDSKFDVIILGHTHWPMVRKIGKTMVVNPGSVGQPRDYDTRASYAVLDTRKKTFKIYRISYDVEKVANQIKKLDFDDDLIKMLKKEKNE